MLKEEQSNLLFQNAEINGEFKKHIDRINTASNDLKKWNNHVNKKIRDLNFKYIDSLNNRNNNNIDILKLNLKEVLKDMGVINRYLDNIRICINNRLTGVKKTFKNKRKIKITNNLTPEKSDMLVDNLKFNKKFYEPQKIEPIDKIPDPHSPKIKPIISIPKQNFKESFYIKDDIFFKLKHSIDNKLRNLHVNENMNVIISTSNSGMKLIDHIKKYFDKKNFYRAKEGQKSIIGGNTSKIREILQEITNNVYFTEKISMKINFVETIEELYISFEKENIELSKLEHNMF